MTADLSKAQINKAGRTLRRFIRGEPMPEEEISRAVGVVQAYRAAHQIPLLKANMGLRSVVRTEGCQVEVSQRLKRMTTIVDKLRREPTMALGNMQDIGGCRAVLGSLDEVRRVERRFRKNRPPYRVYDYISNPRTSGYRGVHVIVGYADKHEEWWAIEVQLRTRVMHEWAIAVERVSGRLQLDIKGGEGPPELVDFLGAVSQAMAIEERGEIVPNDLLERIRNLRPAALAYIGGQP